MALSLCLSSMPVSTMAEPTKESTSELLQEATLEAPQDVSLEITPETTPEITPEITPEATPEITPEATPETPSTTSTETTKTAVETESEQEQPNPAALFATTASEDDTISGNSYPTESLGRKRYKFNTFFKCERCKQTFPMGTDDGQHKCIANLFTYTVQGNQLIYKWEIQVRSCDGTSKKMSYNDDLIFSCSKTDNLYTSLGVGSPYNGKGGFLNQYIYYYSVPHAGEATCISSANCTMCGESYLAEHNYGTEWTIGETTHYQSCQTEGCTAYSVAEPHSYDNGMCTCGGMEPAVLNGDTYEIANAGQLAWYGSNHVDHPGVLVADITIGSKSAPYEGWTPVPIGGGVFDGQDHTITMYLNGAESLFGTQSVIYQNITLKGSMTTSSNSNVGAIVGNGYGVRLNRILSYVDISNTGSGYVGGLIGNFGERNDLAKINQCGVYADIVSQDSQGNPTGHVGGLVGHGWDQTRYWLIYNSAFYGTATGGEGTTGAMLGYSGTNKNTNFCKIVNCYYPEGYRAVGGGHYNESNIQAEPKSQEAFASGEVAWLLNEKTNNGTWKQILGKNSLPTHKGKGVYYGYIHCGQDAEKVYSNCSWASDQTIENHTFDEDAICVFCHGYDAPEKIDGVYQIVKLGHLCWYGLNGNGTNAVLCNDLTIGSAETPYEDWVPVNVNGRAVFDGQGHKITMYLTTYNIDKETEQQHIGLFNAGNCTIRNLTLDGAITCNSSGGGNDSPSARVGTISPSGYGVTFEQILSYVKINNLGTAPTGGIVGYFGGNGATIKNCAVYADISGTGQVGGLVGAGWNGNQAWKIQNCAYWGDLTGADGKTGALMGYSETDKGTNSSSIQNSYYRSIYASVGGGDNASALANIDQSEGKIRNPLPTEKWHGNLTNNLRTESGNRIWESNLILFSPERQ